MKSRRNERGRFRTRRRASHSGSAVRKLAISAYISLVSIFLVAYLAAYVHPQNLWWLQLFGPFVPALSVPLVLVSIPIILGGSRILLAAQAALLILILLRMPTLVSGGAQDDDASLLVMSYNAKHINPRAEEALESLLRSAQPEIIALQEARMLFTGDDYGASAEIPVVWRSGLYAIPAPETESQINIHLPILSTVPWASFAEHSLAPSPRPPLSDVSRAVLQWKGRDIAIYNVHLRSYVSRSMGGRDARTWPRRLLDFSRGLRDDIRVRARETQELMKLLEREPHPYVVVGDLNATRHNWEYGRLSKDLRDAGTFSTSVWDATFPASLPLVRIDFIFASSEWTIIRSETGPRLTSDHRPVIAELALPSRSTQLRYHSE